MRSFQVMRHTRRVTPTSNELVQSITQSNQLASIRKRQNSLLASDNDHNHNSISFDKSDDLIVNR